MKYIKLFEDKIDSWIEDAHREHNFMNSLKKGDYVIIYCEDHGVHDELMILTDDPEENADGFTIHANNINGEHYQTYYDHEIVRKVTPQEAEFLIATNKYNV